MADINDAVSKDTLTLIGAAYVRSAKARVAVMTFVDAARLAIREFDREVDPLHLPDDEYETVIRNTGLRDLVVAAWSMSVMLTSLSAATSAE